jgi:peptidyl-prolyl cis-trans isomerase A (cyclophilin A)
MVACATRATASAPTSSPGSIRMKRHLHLAVAICLTTLACEEKVDQPAPARPAVASAPVPAPSLVPAPSAAPIDPALLDPSAAKATAPARFKVKFATTKGDFVVEVTRAWAPLGADRFYNLVKLGFFTDIGCFRVVPGFVVQFGIHGNPAVSKAWKEASIKDDKKSKQSNKKGTLTFAKSGPDTRTTQLFINYRDNARLDADGFTPFGIVIQGMEVVEAINKEYEQQPDQEMIFAQGNSYLHDIFRRLDYIKSVTFIE